jgi:hypothetical protein
LAAVFFSQIPDTSPIVKQKNPEAWIYFMGIIAILLILDWPASMMQFFQKTVPILSGIIGLTLIKLIFGKPFRWFEYISLIVMLLPSNAFDGYELYGGLIHGGICALLVYIFLDYLNYDEANPAYFLWVSFGLGGIVIGIRQAFIPEMVNEPLSYILAIFGIAAYAFIFSFLLLGILNRFIKVKIRDFSDSFQY